MLTPEQVHRGLARQVLEERKQVLEEAYERHPERFVRGKPKPAQPPSAVWINPPAASGADKSVVLAPQPSAETPEAGAVSRGNSEAALDAASASG